MWCSPSISTWSLTFLLFINGLPNVSKKLKFYIFANDTNIYYESECPEKLVKKLNTEMRSVKRWLDANKLSLNLDNTNYVNMHPPGSKLPPLRLKQATNTFPD